MPIALIDYFAATGLAGLFLVVAMARAKTLVDYFKERKRKRQFKDFEDVISGKNNDPVAAKKFFAGEIKLLEEVYVFIPVLLDRQKRAELEKPIDAALRELGQGHVVRGYSINDSCGFDVYLNDFVQGVDLLRKKLVELQAPRGTLIEYTGGDLPIYEE